MENLIYLSYINELRSRIDSKIDLVQVVLGPRQVGKTTSILKLIEDKYSDRSHYVSADAIFNASSSWLREQWMYAQSQNKILFIDEIQKVQNWAEVIKSLYDESKKIRKPLICILLGSSSLEIHQGLTESLTGRFQLIRAFHWNYLESKQGYDLNFEEYLKFGGYPGSYRFINSHKQWLDYVQNSILLTVVEKDILQNQTVKNPALFKQAFEILTAYPAQEISYTKLLGQLQDKGNVELIKYYISLYEGAFLIKSLEKFSNKQILVKSSSPKILPLAPCIAYLQTKAEYSAEERGRIFEVLVGSQLVRTQEPLYYWRRGNYEVDYVLKYGKALFAIEVKSGLKKNAKGLDAFKLEFPGAQISLITPENYFEFEADPLKFLQEKSL